MLELAGLSIGYGAGRPVAALPDLSVPAGSFVCLLGRNGQGKSTLLRTLAGLLAPLAGHARLGAENIADLPAAERARRIGVVLTERASAPGLSVRELVEMGRLPFTGLLGRLEPHDHELAEHALAAVAARHLAEREVDTLSDGERQRVMIARALAQQPRLLLLDEITAFLDLPSRVTICAGLRRIARQRGIAIILSSHDLELALQTADALWILPGDGTLRAGAPEDLALAGVLGEAFDHPEIAFSVASGRFEATTHAGRPARVEGEGPAAAWARRALARTGWRTADAGEAADVVVETGPEGWWAPAPGGRRCFTRLADLVRALGAP